MQSENFDNKLKEVLDNRPEGMDNPGWDRMEQILDKHLPQKKDKRRIFFILFFFLVAGGGSFILWQKGNTGNKQAIASETKTSNITEPGSGDKSSSTNKISSSQKSNRNESINSNNEEQKTKTERSTVEVTTGNDIASKKEIEKNNTTVKNENIDTKEVVGKTIANKPGKKSDQKITSVKSNEVLTKNDPALINTENAETTNYSKEILTNTNISSTEKNDISNKKEEPAKTETDVKTVTLNTVSEKTSAATIDSSSIIRPLMLPKAKQKNNLMSRFFFSLTAGPDISSVGFQNSGKLRIAAGGGIGYKISDRLTVRTGYYTVHKVYEAAPEDYNPPPNFWNYYPNLKSIDADCKVNEWPIVVDYNFNVSKNKSFFVSAGVSSLWMKKEDYEYYYKPNSSPTYISYTRTYTNQHKHLFSVLNLSGGYTRSLNKHISLRAEPYVKIAMRGIGYGKVDLNSGGILFSAIISPFEKNK